MSVKSLGTRDIIGTFFARLEADPAFAIINALAWFNRDTDQEVEKYKWLGQVPMMREWIGGRKAKGFNDFGYEIQNRKYEATLAVAIPDMERDKTAQIMTRIQELAQAANLNKWSLLAELIKLGGSKLCYDGQFFFDTDHQEGDSGVQSNSITYDVADPAIPTAKEMQQAIFNSISQMLMFKNDQGEPMNEFAKSFMVMVPILYFQSALAAVTATQLDQGETNPLSKLKENGYNIDVAPAPRLGVGVGPWTDKFATFRTDSPMKPFIIQEEKPLSMKHLDETSEHAIKEDEVLFTVDSREGAGYGLWQYAVQTQLN